MEPTYDELIKIVKRDRWIKDLLANRISALVAENAELMALLQESQGDLQALQASILPNGDAAPSQSPPEASESPVASGAVSSVP